MKKLSIIIAFAAFLATSAMAQTDTTIHKKTKTTHTKKHTTKPKKNTKANSDSTGKM